MEIYSDLNIDEGRFLGEYHQVIKVLGEGCHGYVCKCLNTETNKIEAVKINKNMPNCFGLAQKEIAILKRLRHLDPDECNIVKYYGSFSHGEHLCIRLELLDQSLAEYIRKKHKLGLRMPELRPVIQQLATALSHLSSVGIIHADIKPDNVMIVDRLQTPLRAKLIDFGVAHSASAADHDSFVQAVSYMSPEALVGSPYSEAVDIWSLGLTAAELITGIHLYPGRTWYEMLCFITETQGQLSDSLLDCGVETGLFFKQEDNSQQRWRLKTPGELGFRTARKHPTSHKLKCLDDLQELMCEDYEHQRHKHLLVDLIKRMLHLDQDQRIKAHEVLRHPFFTEILPETSETNTHMENTPCRETATVTLTAESKDTQDVQLETRAQNGDGIPRCLIRRIQDTVLCWFTSN